MRRFRTVTLLLLLLAYTGQSLAAAALSCPMMASGSTDTSDTAHAGHHMPADSPVQPVSGTDGCCDGGLCVMSYCQATAALPSNATDKAAQYVAAYPHSSEASSPSHTVDSLYRPPISR